MSELQTNARPMVGNTRINKLIDGEMYRRSGELSFISVPEPIQPVLSPVQDVARLLPGVSRFDDFHLLFDRLDAIWARIRNRWQRDWRRRLNRCSWLRMVRDWRHWRQWRHRRRTRLRNNRFVFGNQTFFARFAIIWSFDWIKLS